MDSCPRCNGVLIKSEDDDGACLPCGWHGWPKPAAIALRDQLREQPGRRLPRQGGRAR